MGLPLGGHLILLWCDGERVNEGCDNDHGEELCLTQFPTDSRDEKREKSCKPQKILAWANDLLVMLLSILQKKKKNKGQ